MSFQPPAPDVAKLLKAWEAWEKGEETPGRTLADLKTSGLSEILTTLAATGWTRPA